MPNRVSSPTATRSTNISMLQYVDRMPVVMKGVDER